MLWQIPLFLMSTLVFLFIYERFTFIFVNILSYS